MWTASQFNQQNNTQRRGMKNEINLSLSLTCYSLVIIGKFEGILGSKMAGVAALDKFPLYPVTKYKVKMII